MSKVQLQVNEKRRGKFFIEEDGEELGYMDVAITEKNLIAYHTEVIPKAEGKGLAKELLNNMVDYARSHHLKVIALCPYVHAQFKRHEDLYGDIWEKNYKDSAA
jgi:predicted GNAT family acetyltransferase